MEQIDVLLRELAGTLGTTIDHLWGVLVLQARISAIQSMGLVLLGVVFGIVLYKFHRRFITQKKREGFSATYNTYEDCEEVGVLMVVASIVWGVFFLVGTIMAFENITNALLNPEYWALKEILGVL